LIRALVAAVLTALTLPVTASAAVVQVPLGGDLSAAYNAAQSGDVLELSTGSYGDWSTPSGSKPVTIKGVPGTKFRTIDAHADNLTFDGVEIDVGFAKAAGLETHGVSGFTFRNGAIGNVTDEKGALAGGSTSTVPLYTTFENVVFHDVRVTDSSVHNECLYSQASGLTVRNSTFENCATFDLFITRGDWWGQPVYGDVTLEGNVFEHSVNIAAGSWHHYGLAPNNGVIRTMRNWRVVNNTFETSVGGGSYPDGASGVWANNIGAWPCAPGITYSHNVGSVCGATDKAISPASSCGTPACSSSRTAAAGWVDPAGGDFHLTHGSPAIDAADAFYAPIADRDGKGRVGKPDAGAYEFGEAEITPSPTPTEPPSPTPTATPTATEIPTPSPTPTVSPELTPEPEPYDPDCAPTCDEEIMRLRAVVADWTIRAFEADSWRARWKARALDADAGAAVLAERIARARVALDATD